MAAKVCLWKVPLMLLLTVVLLAASATTVFAEGETPPAPDGSETEQPPVVEETPQPTATEEAPVLEPTPTPTEPAATPQVTDEPTAEAPAIEPTEAAAATPGDDQQTETPEPAGADPYFMVGSLKYMFLPTTGTCPATGPGTGVADCVTATNPIQAALDYIRTNSILPTDRTLYIERGAYAGNVDLNGATYPILGQMKGITGSILDAGGAVPAGGLTPPTVTINGNVTITGTLAGFTLKDVLINGQLYVHDNTGALTLNNVDVANTAGTGIRIENQKGAITLNRVDASSNRDQGLNINNTASAMPAATITIIASNFSDNNVNDTSLGLSGASIDAKGAVTLDGVTASRNWGRGIYIHTLGAVTVRNSLFLHNRDIVDGTSDLEGLFVYTPGAVTLQNVQTNGNDYDGVRVSAGGAVTVTGLTAISNGGMGLRVESYTDPGGPGASSFSMTDAYIGDSAGAGLKVLAGNAITITNLSVYNSGTSAAGHHGIWLDNCLYDDVLEDCVSKGQPVTLTNVSSNNNSGTGLVVLSHGVIRLTNVQARNNDDGGARLINQYSNSRAGVTIAAANASQWNEFSNNASILNSGIDNLRHGLDILTHGAISISQTSAMGNEFDGIWLRNGNYALPITLSQVYADDNGRNGVRSEGVTGAFTWKIGSASGNNGYGALVSNPGIAGKAVVISGVNFHRNTGGWGLKVNSAGAVTLTNVNASNNLTYGIWATNLPSPRSAPVTITSTTGIMLFSTNAGYGVFVQSTGAIIANQILAQSNALDGIFLDNYDASRHNPVTGTGLYAEYNVGTGIYIQSSGNVTLTDPSASNNGSGGLFIDAGGGGDQTGFGGSVSILRKNVSASGDNLIFNNNGHTLVADNVHILAQGAVILWLRQADTAGGNGVWIKNSADLLVRYAPVSILGMDARVMENGSRGVYVETDGAISMSNLGALHNASHGIYLDNQKVSAQKKSVTLINVYATENDGGGIHIQSYGAVTGTNTHSYSNNDAVGISGMIINTEGKVTLTAGSGLMNFSNNTGAGLSIITKGAVIIRGAALNSNGTYALSITITGAASPVTLTSVYSSASANGISITTPGAVSLTDVAVSGSTTDNIVINNSGAASALPVTLTRVSGNSSSAGSGLLVTSRGVITLTQAAFGNNDMYGAVLDNCVMSAGSCTLSNRSGVVIKQGVYGNYFIDNGGTGLQIITGGKTSIINVEASENGVSGVQVNNEFANATGGVQVNVTKGFTNLFNNNGGYGLLIDTTGAVSVFNVNANGNGNNGISINQQYNQPGGNRAAMPVTLANINTHLNEGRGVLVYTYGKATLTNIKASQNDIEGMLVNTGMYFFSPVVITGGEFHENGSTGLYVETIGNIIVTNVSANWNTSSGMVLINNIAPDASYKGSNGTITINSTGGYLNSFLSNSGYGVQIASKMTVSINRMRSSGNAQSGALINTKGGVNLTTSRFEGNAQTGLVIKSNLPVVLNGVVSSNNGTAATDAYGFTYDAVGPAATLTLLNCAFNGNYGYGVFYLYGSGATGGMKMSNTTIFANDVDRDGQRDLMITDTL